MMRKYDTQNGAAVWVDGLVPSRYSLGELASPNYLLSMGIDPLDVASVRQEVHTSLKAQPDQVFSKLFRLSFDTACKENAARRNSIHMYYIRPPCKKPNRREQKRLLKLGDYSPDHLTFAGYGPLLLGRARRKDRYRQIVTLGHIDDALVLQESVRDSIQKTAFNVIEDCYNPLHGPDLYDMEVELIMKRLLGAHERENPSECISWLSSREFHMEQI